MTYSVKEKLCKKLCKKNSYCALFPTAFKASAFLFMQAKQRHEVVVLPPLRDTVFLI
jgi:hypothetical protein